MRLQSIAVRDEDISSVQFFPAVKNAEGAIVENSYFDITLKSGKTLTVVSGAGIFNKVVEGLGIE
jgi:hypothetical protein